MRIVTGLEVVKENLLKNKMEEYIDYLYWDLYRKHHINYHAVMELFKKRFDRYPYYCEVSTFKMEFKDKWYENLDEYQEKDVNNES